MQKNEHETSGFFCMPQCDGFGASTMLPGLVTASPFPVPVNKKCSERTTVGKR
jgi:hypothetical protein